MKDLLNITHLVKIIKLLGIKEGPLLGFKDKNIYGDVLWDYVGLPDSIYYGIRVEKSDGKSEGFWLEHLILQHLASLTTQCMVLLILPKLENNLVMRKGH